MRIKRHTGWVFDYLVVIYLSFETPLRSWFSRIARVDPEQTRLRAQRVSSDAVVSCSEQESRQDTEVC